MNKYNETKQILKNKAVEIRAMKLATSNGFREGRPAGLQWSLVLKKEEYRKMHIAISMARGRTMEQIEPKVREDHKLTDTTLAYIESLRLAILASWEEEMKAKELLK